MSDTVAAVHKATPDGRPVGYPATREVCVDLCVHNAICLVPIVFVDTAGCVLNNSDTPFESLP